MLAVRGPVLPVEGAPLFLETEEKRQSSPPGATPVFELNRTSIYRDTDGRIRVEREGSSPMIEILDPIGGVITILLPVPALAFRAILPKFDPENPAATTSAAPAAMLPSTSNTESLGNRTFEGIEFAGSRVTTITGTNEAITGVEERWVSAELGVIGMTSFSSPTAGERTARIRNVIRGEPDPALFVIPPNYTIQQELAIP
jgi:hypothetical protein